MRPDIVAQHFERELSVERHSLGHLVALALAPANVDVAVLDAEEERGAEGDGGAAGGGELAQDGHDGGALVGLGAVQGSAAERVFGEWCWRCPGCSSSRRPARPDRAGSPALPKEPR